MTPASVYTLFFSPTGTTARTADAIAAALARDTARPDASIPVRRIDLTHAAAAPVTLPPDAVAVIAVPVYGGHVPPLAAERMKQVRGTQTPAVIVAVYGNRAFEKAPAELAALAAAQGFRPVAAGAFIGEHSYSLPATPIAAGRPDADDLARAAAFGAAVRQKLASAKADEAPATVDVHRLKAPATPLWPLLRFIVFALGYLRRQKRHPVVYLPVTNADLCTLCGRCAAVCPTEAIRRGDELHTDPARCIRCCACVKGCPVGARTFDTPFAAALARNFGKRKPPVTLL